MYIKYLSGPRAGQFDDAPNSQQTDLLVKAGIIEIIPMPQRGQPGWLEAKREREAHRQASLSSKEHFPTQPVWKVRQLDSGKIVVERLLGTERLSYGEVFMLPGGVENKHSEKQLLATLKAEGCPQNVIEQFLAAKKAPNKLAVDHAQHEQAVAAQAAQHEREKSFKQF
jgi:hypothetical protein